MLISEVRNSMYNYTLGTICTCTDKAFSFVQTRGNSLSVLASRVTQLDSYRNALQQFQRMTPQVIDYTLNLLVQLESIQR